MLGATVLGVFLGAMRRSTVDELGDLLERAERAAVQDDLTGLLNRRGLAMVGEQVVASARRSGNAVHCVFVDVDGLKDVNDRLGHLAGDRVLLAVADAVRLSVRGGDVVARWGGDEFCVLGPGPGTAPVDLEKRIVARVQELPPDDVPGWLPRVSAGLGDARAVGRRRPRLAARPGRPRDVPAAGAAPRGAAAPVPAGPGLSARPTDGVSTDAQPAAWSASHAAEICGSAAAPRRPAGR